MENMLEYKGYHAKIEFDVEDMLFVGSVFGIRDSLNFHGTTTQELIESFHQSIDNYWICVKNLDGVRIKSLRGRLMLEFPRSCIVKLHSQQIAAE